jgi:chromosome partitioning protein
MKKITLTNNKGGVTKTTSTHNIGYVLSQNYKVGLIDFDTQQNLSLNLESEGGTDLATVLKKRKMEISDFSKTANPNLFILKNNGDVNVSLFTQFEIADQSYILLDCLDSLPQNAFDFILIDTPPNLELQTLNALLASDYVIIPATLETNSVIGVQKTLNSLKKIKERLNNNLNFLGVVIAKYDVRNKNTNKEMEDCILDIIGEPSLLFDKKIRTNTNFSRNQNYKISALEDKNDRRGGDDYIELTEELLKKIK